MGRGELGGVTGGEDIPAGGEDNGERAIHSGRGYHLQLQDKTLITPGRVSARSVCSLVEVHSRMYQPSGFLAQATFLNWTFLACRLEISLAVKVPSLYSLQRLLFMTTFPSLLSFLMFTFLRFLEQPKSVVSKFFSLNLSSFPDHQVPLVIPTFSSSLTKGQQQIGC